MRPGYGHFCAQSDMPVLHAFMQSMSPTLHWRMQARLASLHLLRQVTFRGAAVGRPVATAVAVAVLDAVPVAVGTAVAVEVATAVGRGAAGSAEGMALGSAEGTPEATADGCRSLSFTGIHLPDHDSHSPVATITTVPVESWVKVPSQPFLVVNLHVVSSLQLTFSNKAAPEGATLAGAAIAVPAGAGLTLGELTVRPLGVSSRRIRWGIGTTGAMSLRT